LIVLERGLSVTSSTPILGAARQLLKLGYPPNTVLQCFRGDVLAMTVRGIGAAAQLESNRFGTGFVKRHSRVRPAPPMRPREAAATAPPTGNKTAVRRPAPAEVRGWRGIPHVMDLAINGHRGPGLFLSVRRERRVFLFRAGAEFAGTLDGDDQ
jgi:hypothetical protein